ncbi:MAG: transglycosylase SLT domain-containing protein [Alloprevotella sp.]
MKKIFYIALALSVCTAGFGTAAQMASHSEILTLTTANDTITDQDEEEYIEEADDEFGEIPEEDEEIEDDAAADDEQPQAAAAEEAKDTIPADIELTEGMLIDVDTLMREWNAKYLSIDSTKLAGNVPDPDAAEYERRLKRLPCVIEMPYNEVVRKYIDLYTGRLSRSVSYMLGAQNFYVPIFEEALEMEGCPLELKYLPVIESALDPQATSRVGAAGLWQFMVATGKKYGLEVNSLVDERRDPLKSSYAAAAYLKSLYAQFGNWTLALAAYNCGPNNVSKAIQRAGGATQDYWQIYPYLPKETRGYVPAFIAANYVMSNYCQHGIIPMQASIPMETDTVMLHRDLHLQQVADLCQVDIEALKALNPQYRQDIVPGLWQPSALRLPTAAVSRFIEWGDSIYAYRAAELMPRRSSVAVNDQYNPRVKSGNGGVTTKRGSSSSRSRARTVTVRKGDTLGAIARRNGTTVAKLKRLNGLKGTNIRAGRKIRVR